MKRLLLGLFVAFSIYSTASAQRSPEAVKLQGQIVCCRDCWAKEDRKTVVYGTSADVAAAAQCIANGDPTLLAVMGPGSETVFYQLETGRFRRPGKNWLDFIGKLVEVTGSTRTKQDIHFIKVDELKVLSSPAAALEPSPQSVVGLEAQLVLKDLFGVDQSLSAYRGRIVVLNFWATYCVPCRKEMPDLSAIQNQYAALGVQVIGAAADEMGDVAKVKQFIKDTKVNFPVWLGASAGDMVRFGLGSALPGTVVIGRDGKVLHAIRGVINPKDLRKQLDTLLAAADVQGRDQVAVRSDRSKASSVPS